MGLIKRKKRPLNREIPHLKDTRLIVIATEGEKTEKKYFEIFQNHKIQVKMLATEDCKSSPEYIFRRLDKFYEDFNLDEEDELWLMIDVDRWKEKELAKVCKGCVQKSYSLAVSNPCFEVWLYLHFTDIVQIDFSCKDFKKELKQIIGSYNSSNLQGEKFYENVGVALKRAKKLDKNNERWPSSFGTQVYKVVEKII